MNHCGEGSSVYERCLDLSQASERINHRKLLDKRLATHLHSFVIIMLSYILHNSFYLQMLKAAILMLGNLEGCETGRCVVCIVVYILY